MGIRGAGELLGVLPPPVAGPAADALEALAELTSLRHAVLPPEDLRAVGELWQRLASQVQSGRLAALAAMDAREDVVPKAVPGRAGAAFAELVLGQRRGTARRDTECARLLRPEAGDLPSTGAAYAAGDVSAAHVEIAMRTHARLRAEVRDVVLPAETVLAGGEVPDDLTAGLADALAQLCTASAGGVRQILVVDAVLAHYSRHLPVADVAALADRIVAVLDPPTLSTAHERRYLHMSQSPDGQWGGRFACGPAQGALLKRVLAAGSAPRPGLAVDADGVEHAIPDPRDLGQRQMDALVDAVCAGGRGGDAFVPGDTAASRDAGAADSTACSPAWPPANGDDEPPAPDGEGVVVREPGVLRGAYPSADLVVVAGFDHVAAAWAAREGELPLDVEPAVFARLQHRYAEHLGGESSGSPPPEECRCRSMEDGTAAGARSADHPPSSEAQHEDGRSSGERRAGPAVGPPWLRRALSAYGVPARLEHVGLLDHQTLELLACNATVRSAVLAPNGAVLDLGRAQRLATPTQKTALLARDGGCVIPGCTVPGDACAAHHVVWWSRGGPTDLGNLALLCGRHHIEVHAGTWEIEMSDGVPWVLPPRWLGVNASALRNAPLGAACARSGDGQHAGHVGAADDEDHDEGDRDHCEHLTPEHESEKGDDDGNGERHDGLQE